MAPRRFLALILLAALALPPSALASLAGADEPRCGSCSGDSCCILCKKASKSFCASKQGAGQTGVKVASCGRPVEPMTLVQDRIIRFSPRESVRHQADLQWCGDAVFAPAPLPRDVRPEPPTPPPRRAAC